MEQCAALTMENADVLMVGLGSTAHSVAQLLSMEKTVPTSVSVRTERTVTTSLGSARAGRDSQANSASKSAHQEHLVMVANNSVSA